MSKVETGAIEAFNNDDGRFGLKVNGQWFNGFGDLPEDYQEKGVEVELQYEETESNGKVYRNVDDVEDDIELVNETDDSEQADGNDAPVSDRQENMGRQKPIEAVGRMYQGCPPSSAEELNQMKVIIKELTSWSQDGEFMVDAQELEGSTADLEETLNELSERIGKVEQKVSQEIDDLHTAQKDIEEKADEALEGSPTDFSKVREFIEEQLEEMQDDSEQETIFDEDDGDREESKVSDDDNEEEKDDE